MKLFIAIFAFLSLVGCVPYPAYRTVQPSAEVRVIDENGSLIDDVNVILFTRGYPSYENFNAAQKTTNGIAKFGAIKDWRIELMFMHGRTHYSWQWCIEKEGYQTITAPYSISDPIFILQLGVSDVCLDRSVWGL